ncbi:hypothetical protein D9M70_554310 [compost metagenome]
MQLESASAVAPIARACRIQRACVKNLPVEGVWEEGLCIVSRRMRAPGYAAAAQRLAFGAVTDGMRSTHSGSALVQRLSGGSPGCKPLSWALAINNT